jgi:hypothetical protein
VHNKAENPPEPVCHDLLFQKQTDHMEQRYSLALALIFPFSAAMAQPSLTEGSANPSPGDNLTYSACDFVEPGAAGM